MTNRAASHRQKFLGALCTALCALASLSSSAGEGGPTTPNALGISASFGKWPGIVAGGIVNWTYNPTNAPNGYTVNNEVVDRITSALNSWMGVCGLTFGFQGINAAADINNMNDNIVVFAWENIGGAAGLAGPFFNTSPATLMQRGFHPYIDGTLRLNPAVFALSGTESPAQLANEFRAFTDTVLHEVGHLIGLGHSDRPVSRMYANPYNAVTSLRQDDIDACRSMYGFPNLSFPLAQYVTPPTGANPFATLWLATSALPLVPVNSITNLVDATLVVRWSVNGPFGPTAVGAVAVDPGGFDSASGGAQIECPPGFGCSGFFSINTYDRMRETPGAWNVDVIIGGQRVQTLPINVSDLLPAINNVPTATFSFTDQPATRQVAASLNVTGDAEANTAIVTWHVPTQGPQAPQNISMFPTNSVQNVDLAGFADHEVFAELSDNSVRYAEDPPNNVGPAGLGFNRLYRYLSSGRNQGPDHDGDNSSDIVFRHATNGQVTQWRMHGNAIIDRGHIAVLNSLNWRVVSDGDFNGDGKSDLMWRNDATAEVFYWQMNGREIVAAASVATPADTNWRVVGRGDYNGDGNSDLMWRHLVTGVVHLWLMNGATIIGSSPVATVGDLQWQVVGDEDADSDGMADLYWFHNGTGQVYFWKMNGATIVSAAEVADIADLNWSVAADGDFSGDRSNDLVWRHAVDGKVYFWQMSGPTILLSSRISIVPDLNWQIAGSGNYNGDAWADLLWVHAVTGEIYQWQQLGFTTLRGAQLGFLTDANVQVVNVN